VSSDHFRHKKFQGITGQVLVTPVYGGASIGAQVKDLKRGTHVVVATPGRLIDLIERKAIRLDQIEYVVLDEADEMLNMGFQEDIEFILQNTPKRESTWLFSATMPKEIRQVSKRYMREPTEITIGKMNAANLSNFFWHGCTEQPGAFSFGCILKNKLDILLKSHIEHFIGLVQHHIFNLIKSDCFPFY